MADQVSVPVEAAAALAVLLAGERRRARANGVDLPAHLVAALGTFTAAERALAGAAAPVPAVPGSGTADGHSELVVYEDAVGAARRAGTVAHSVRRAARRGTLRGRQDADGRWLFRPEDVDEWGGRVGKARDRRQAVEGEAELRARRAELEAQLADLDGRLAGAEAERDAAKALREASQDPVGQWRAEESLAGAQARVAELLVERRPVQEALWRIAEILSPLDQRQAEIDRARITLRGREVLGGVLPLVDRLVALVDEAQPILRQANDQVPTDLRRFAEAWRDRNQGANAYDARGRFVANADVADAKQRLARLEAMT